MSDLAVGDKVSKIGGDYHYDGTVVAVLTKLSGAVRYVVEDDRGLLFIFNRRNLVRAATVLRPTLIALNATTPDPDQTEACDERGVS